MAVKTNFSYSITEERKLALKIVAAHKGKTINTILDEAVDRYLAKEEFTTDKNNRLETDL